MINLGKDSNKTPSFKIDIFDIATKVSMKNLTSQASKQGPVNVGASLSKMFSQPKATPAPSAAPQTPAKSSPVKSAVSAVVSAVQKVASSFGGDSAKAPASKSSSTSSKSK